MQVNEFDTALFSERLREFAKNRYGIKRGSLTKLASEVGITTQQLNRYLNGTSRPSASFLDALQRIGADLNHLLGGDSDSAQKDSTMLAVLRREGIYTPEQLEALLKAMKDYLRTSEALRDALDL